MQARSLGHIILLVQLSIILFNTVFVTSGVILRLSCPKGPKCLPRVTKTVMYIVKKVHKLLYTDKLFYINCATYSPPKNILAFLDKIYYCHTNHPKKPEPIFLDLNEVLFLNCTAPTNYRWLKGRGKNQTDTFNALSAASWAINASVWLFSLSLSYLYKVEQLKYF
jgi:hypothetical protein